MIRLLIFILTGLNPLNLREPLSTIYFNTSSYTVDSSQLEKIKKIARILRTDSTLMVDCIGYTDKSGSPEINRLIALKRALSVKRVLTEKFRIPEERIFVIASGPDTTTSNPRLARRVDIVVHNPDAILKDYQNKVFIQPFYYPLSWLRPRGEDLLYGYYQVKTGNLSLAKVYFPGKGNLELGSEALLIIYGKKFQRQQQKDIQDDINLVTGNLLTLLSKEERPPSLSVKTPGARIKLNATKSKIGVNKEKTTLVSIFEGYAEVIAKGKSVKLQSGEGTYVVYGKTPANPKKLPHVPLITSPHSGDTINFSDTLIIKWSGNTPKYRLQVYIKDSAEKLVRDTMVESKQFMFVPSKSNISYKIVVTSIDSFGLESEPSLPVEFYVAPIPKHTSKLKLKIETLKIKRLGNNEYELTLKGNPKTTLYILNHIMEIGEDSIVNLRIHSKNALIPIKIKDRHGNVAYDTIFIKNKRYSLIQIHGGLIRLKDSSNTYYYPFIMGIGYKTSIFNRLFGGCKISYAPDINTAEISFSLSYIFPVSHNLYPEFLFSYGIATTAKVSSSQGLGVCLNVKLNSNIYLSPGLTFYSIWGNEDWETPLAATLSISYAP